MTLDQLIAELQEAKEHYVPGKSKVHVKFFDEDDSDFIIIKVEYDNYNVTITI